MVLFPLLLISQGQPLLAQELFPLRSGFLLRSRLFASLLTGKLYTQFGMASHITCAPLNPFQRDLEEAMFERVAPQGMELKISEEVPP